MALAATWMDKEILKLSEVTLDRQISYDTVYMWDLKNGTHLSLKHKIELQNIKKNTYGYQRGMGGGETI